VLAGGFATWFRQRRWRRAARQHEADAEQLRAQVADLHSRVTGPEQRNPQRLAAPLWDTNRRDKHGATL
jgi:hypothetical protein